VGESPAGWQAILADLLLSFCLENLRRLRLRLMRGRVEDAFGRVPLLAVKLPIGRENLFDDRQKQIQLRRLRLRQLIARRLRRTIRPGRSRIREIARRICDSAQCLLLLLISQPVDFRRWCFLHGGAFDDWSCRRDLQTL